MLGFSRNAQVAAVLLSAAIATPAAATTIFVDQNATYRYINATNATNLGSPGPNWFQPGFDDSGWFTGSGPFSSNPVGSTIHDNANVNLPFAPGPTQPVPTSFTQWDTFHDPFLRTHFELSAPTALTVWIAVDNGIGTAANNPLNGTGAATGMYINGVLSTGIVNAEGGAFRWESVFNIDAAHTFAGDNVFALQLEDHGVLTGFDMMITSQLGDNPPFTTNPPPGVPEPATAAVFAIGLVGLGVMRRRRGA
jgi:hypothetical protein